MKNRNEFKKIIMFKFSNSKVSHIFTDKISLKMQYKIYMGKSLNIDNPKTFNEKLQWLKLYDRNPDYIKMVDKYEVREYISEHLGEEYLIPMIGIFNKFDDIDFNKLPQEFVIKCTHDSGSVILCKDKNKFDINFAKQKINRKLNENLFWFAREWPYKHAKPKIIIEQYMRDSESDDLKDYKFYCFNGQPRYLYVSEGLSNHETASIEFFDMEFNPAPFSRMDFKRFEKKPKVPTQFELMKELAKRLSKNIPFLRVDFYEINKKIYFGELTFYPSAGYMPFYPEEWDLKLGKMLELPKDKIEEKNEK